MVFLVIYVETVHNSTLNKLRSQQR